MSNPQHGGNISQISALFPNAPLPFIDLSTGITPYGYKLGAPQKEWQHRLAEQAEVEQAHAAAAHYYGAKAVLAPGMQPLMFALACLRLKEHGPTKIGVFSPSYSEHARVWSGVGHTLATPDEGDVVIICNPNNPDGKIIPPAKLLLLAEKLATRGGWLIVDEAFMDMTPELSIISAVTTHNNVVVMRSTGKFFGIAGMRVSCAIAPAAWREWLRVAVGPWPLTTQACRQLPVMWHDKKWATLMRAQLKKEAAIWRDLLAHYFVLIGHTDLFTLVESGKAANFHHRLMEHGILVRKFEHHPEWLRFGLPEFTHHERIKNALEDL